MTDPNEQPNPYAHDPTATRRSGQQPYSQQGYGQPGYGMQPYTTPARRPVWKVVIACVLFVWVALASLGTLASLISPTSGAPSFDTSPAEAIGYLFGMFLFIIGPLVVGILLLRRPKTSDAQTASPPPPYM